MGFRPAGFVLVRWIQALCELISALSWAFLDASKELVLISKGFRKKVAEKAHFGLGPRLESPRFEWTWKQADCVHNAQLHRLAKGAIVVFFRSMSNCFHANVVIVDNTSFKVDYFIALQYFKQS